jgi:mRNA-degrading endonuclease YafQ of YafQ-DinJ toxin-antitoxin module
MELIFKKLFKKNAKKLVRWNKKLELKINEVIFDFSNSLFKSKYYRKQLKGIWENIHELEIWWDIRIIAQILIIDKKIFFLNIWTHSSLELSSSKKIKL